jgi:outer membrane protein assembly factor BamB/HEAT repeat protein
MDAPLNIEKKRNISNSNNHRGEIKLVKETEYPLPDLLKYGIAVVTNIWNYSANDWVSSVQAADVDGDADIEILLGSRDGFVRALTRWGSRKWETRLGTGKWVSSVMAVPQPEDGFAQSDNVNPLPYVIAGSRDGRVYALDQHGHALPDWEEYDTGRVVRQIYIHPQWPERVIVGSESRGLYVLDCYTGKPVYSPFFAQGEITSVFAYDIDADGEPEILAGSADGYVYILSFATGELRGKIPVGNKVYAVYAAHLEPEGRGAASILVSTNGKDLSAWTVKAHADKEQLAFKRIWMVTTKDRLFSNRLHTIAVADLNNDGFAEILVGSEDKHLYVLDHRGKPLWKHAVDSCVNSIAALDINFDGLIEVIVGLEDNQVRVFHIELVPKLNLYNEIQKAYKKLGRTRQRVLNALPFADYLLLRDIVGNEETQGSHMELEHAKLAMGTREYDQALATLLRLERQRVQYYWRSPITDIGHIRTFCLGDIAGDPKDEILLGNDEGVVTAIDIERRHILWQSPSLGERIWMVDMGTTDLHEYDTLLATLADDRVHVLSHTGAVLSEKEFVLEGERLWCVSIRKQDRDGQQPEEDEPHFIKEILLGSERKIYVYDANLREQRLVIHAPQGVRIVRTSDLTGPASSEIICAGMDNQVYAYGREGKELWRYPTQDRIRAICTKDIDGDQQLEVLVGSEDRYVYVLDRDGHLKWRYYMPHRVLSIDALDVDKDGHCEILVGVADSYMYVLNAEGDELWRFKANDRVRAVCARDLNDDDEIEIMVASDDQIVLLQMLDLEDLRKRIRECLGLKLRLEATNPGTPGSATTLRKLARSDDEYIRAFAIRVLAGSNADHIPEDFTLIQNALKDKSPEVRRIMVDTIIALAKVSIRKGDQYSVRQARRFLSQLASDPSYEVRNQLISNLHQLTETDSSLCFEYLERFTNNVDVWVRRAVARQLHKLVEKYPEQSLRLLMEMVQDPNEWIRQECGRSLAHYFDVHKRQYITSLHDLLMRGSNLLVIEQISYSAKDPLIKRAFRVLARIMAASSEEQMLSLLDEVVEVLKETSKEEIDLGEDTLHVYEEFNQLLRVRKVDDIVQYVRITTPQVGSDIRRFYNVIQIFDSFLEVVEILKVYQRRQALGDRASSLLNAHDCLEDIRKDLDAERIRRSRQKAYSVQLPEDLILDFAQQRWSEIVGRELQQLRGKAILNFELPEQTASIGEQLTILLVITNTGRCPADNVCITLEASDQFTIMGSNQRELAEISTSRASTVDFVIYPQADPLQLEFTIVYDDAERREKKKTFRDRLPLHEFHGQSFTEIPNPYTTGTPVRTTEMFYGRGDDLEFLREKLTNTANNTVVMLTGQRRAGKTSLIYQLTNERQLLSPHCAVLIDLQTLALNSNVGRLLAGIATTIYDELKKHGINVARPNGSLFDKDATSAFNQFLRQVLNALSGCKLILLFDEFEVLQEKIREGHLNADFLQYLRGLMQHSEGINFLLAGAPRIRHLTEGYWSTFFNLASHHPLSKLKPTDAERLIEEPVERYLQYDHFAIERIRQLTGDQPYLIHIMCDTLIRDRNKKQKNYVNINDVNLAVEQILDRGENQFAWIWNELARLPEAHFILSVLAQEQSDEGRVFSFGDVKEAYMRQGLYFEQERVLRCMQHLVREEFVEESENATQFRIPVGLIRGWLQKAWPPEKVVRIEKLAKV